MNQEVESSQIQHLWYMVKKVYKQRGLKLLVKRIYEFIEHHFQLFLLRPADVLYVSGCPGGSFFYRCKNQSEELMAFGIKNRIITQGTPFLQYLVKKYDVFILQRVIVHKNINPFLAELERQKKEVFFETDDLVFNPDYLSYMDYYHYMEEEEKTWYENGIGREILENPYVKNVVVSTDFLARAVQKKYPDKKVWVSYNKMGASQVKNAEAAYKKRKSVKKEDGKVRLGYFSGSKSHNKDFEAIAEPLLRILKENKNAVLFIVGHLDLDERFDEVRGQIEYAPFVPLKKLQELILTADINLAPLEKDNPFCEGKSALKYWEAGIVGVPTIASATEDFVRCIEPGKSGFLATTSDEWYQTIQVLLFDKQLRESVGEEARKDAYVRHIAERVEPSSYIQHLQGVIGN